MKNISHFDVIERFHAAQTQRSVHSLFGVFVREADYRHGGDLLHARHHAATIGRD